MRNKLFYIFIIFMLFIGVGSVSASGTSFAVAEGDVACFYDVPFSDSKWDKIMCTFHPDGKYKCEVYNGSDDKKLTFEKYNGGNVKDNIKSDVMTTKKCPYIVYIETRSFGGLEAYAFTTKDDANQKMAERKKFYENVSVLTEEHAEKLSYEEQVKEYVEYLNHFGVDSVLDDNCILDDGVYRKAGPGETKAYKASMCEDSKRVVLEYLKEKNDIVEDLVAEDLISIDNTYVKQYMELSNKVMMSLGNTSLTHNPEEEQVREEDFESAIEEKRIAKAREKDNQGTDVRDCAGLLGPNTLKLLNSILTFVMILGPIVALILGTYELIVAVAYANDDDKKKGILKLRNRLIAAALLLLAPYIVKLILNMAGRTDNCIDAIQNASIWINNL